MLLVEAAERIGGTRLLSSGQMSAGGEVLQRSRAIEATPQGSSYPGGGMSVTRALTCGKLLGGRLVPV